MFEFVDAHAHLQDMTVQDQIDAAMNGVTTIISPCQFATKRQTRGAGLVDTWNNSLEYYLPRAAGCFIKGYAMIGVSMVACPVDEDLEKCFELLPEYLKKENVIALGEVGFEPGSPTNNDHDYQRKNLIRQIQIAKDCGVVIDIHTPNPEDKKIAACEESLALCKEAGIPMDKVVIDHCTDATIKMVLDAGAWAAISCQPWRKAHPDNTAQWIMEYKSDRVFVDSDCGPLISDPLSVPKVAYELRKLGASDELISMACCTNAKKAYGIG